MGGTGLASFSSVGVSAGSAHEAGPRWISSITFSAPLDVIQDNGPVWASSFIPATAILSTGPRWSSSVVTSATIVTSIHEHGPKFRLFYNITNENGPIWRLREPR